MTAAGAQLLERRQTNGGHPSVLTGTVGPTQVYHHTTMETKHLEAPQQAAALTPTDMGLKLGISGQAVNRLLIERGYQTEFRDSKNRPVKEPTEIGQPFAVWLDTGKQHSDGTPVRQLKWSADIIEHLQPAAKDEAA